MILLNQKEQLWREANNDKDSLEYKNMENVSLNSKINNDDANNNENDDKNNKTDLAQEDSNLSESPRKTSRSIQPAGLDVRTHRQLAKMQLAQENVIPENFIDQFASRICLHPVSRLFVACGISLLNFWILVEDPIAHSNISSEIPIVGNVFALMFTKWPSDPSMVIGKFCFAVIGLITGCLFGKFVVHQRCLRKSFSMFRNDQGSFMVMFWTCVFSMYICSLAYNILFVPPVNNSGNIASEWKLNGKMGVTNEDWSKLTGIGCWTGDFLTAFMVFDMMLQDRQRYKSWALGLRNRWKGKFRIISFWIATPIAIIVVLIVLVGSVAKDGMSAWDSFNQNKLYSGELARCFMCSIITVMDLLIVIQDWDFPDFDNDAAAINLPGMDIQNCTCSLNKCFKSKDSESTTKVVPTKVAPAASSDNYPVNDIEDEDEESREKRLGIQSTRKRAYNIAHGGKLCMSPNCNWITPAGVDHCLKPECQAPWHHVVVTGKWFNYGIIFNLL